MENHEFGREGGVESNGIELTFRTEEAPPRPWVQASRTLAIEYDRSRSTDFDLGNLWRRLRSCEWQVRDTFATASRLYAVVEKAGNDRRQRVNDPGMAMIEQVLLGQSSKAVAIDRQVSDSTVAVAIRKRLRLMGLSCRLRAVPLLLVIAARAARGEPPTSLLGRIARLTDDPAASSWVISAAQPDCRFPAVLSEAENEVLLHVLEGKSYVQIAAARDTSTRTVANQLAAVFRKLGVSGYGQTLDLLLSRAFGAEASEPSPARAERDSLRLAAV